MKVLAIADRGPAIDLPETVRSNQIDLVITLGDLTREDILGLEQITHIPKIGVYGNHDSGTYMPELGIMDMHLKTWVYQGLRFGGFQGCVRYKDNPDAIMCTQEEATSMFGNFPPVDVLLCHCPPRGINDENELAHQGFEATRAYIDTHSTRLLMHGHTYPTPESLITQHGTTRIEYIFGYKIIEM